MATDTSRPEDPFDLKRFKAAQDGRYGGYATALSEMRDGRKRTHWIWYVFPQHEALGFSRMSTYYGISGLEEAEAYLADEILGARLIEISQVVLTAPSSAPSVVMGSDIDALKLRSSMTLFASVEGAPMVFQEVLDKFYGGERDLQTELLLGRRSLLNL